MADRTSIEWTDATWTPIKGCSRHSPGCINCYAEIMAARFSQPGQWGEGLARIVDTPQGKDHRWTGVTRFDDGELLKPLRWKKPRRIFVCSTSDLFHESVPDEWIDQVFAVMALCPQHIFQVLTKRADRMRNYMIAFEDRPEAFGKALAGVTCGASLPRQRGIDTIDAMVWPLPNVWLGVSVEDQQRANERIPDLLATPASVRWLSCEPLLDFISLEEAWHGESALNSECWGQCGWCKAGHPPLWNCQRESWKQYEPGAVQRSGVDWVVVGGESGPNARPMELEAARSIRDQCADADVPFFFKQWGAHVPCGQMLADGRIWTNGSNSTLLTTKKLAGRYLDGVQHDGMPV